MPKVIDVHCASREKPLHGHGVGDAILMLAVIQGVQDANPGAHVRAVVKEGRVPWINLGWPHCVTLESKAPLFGELWPQRHESLGGDTIAIARGMCRAEMWAAEVGVKYRQPAPRIPAEARAWARDMQTRLFGEKPVVWLSPWACANERTWPLRRWAELRDGLLEAGYALAGVHCGREYFLDNVTWFEDTAFPADRTAAMFELAKLVIGNDSGMVHLAGFLNVPALAVCGPTVGSCVFDNYKSVRTLNGPLSCDGCLGIKADYRPRWCRLGCENLWSLSAKWVLLKALEILA